MQPPFTEMSNKPAGAGPSVPVFRVGAERKEPSLSIVEKPPGKSSSISGIDEHFGRWGLNLAGGIVDGGAEIA